MALTFKKLTSIIAITSCLFLLGCEKEKPAALNTIKVGVIAGSEEQVAEIAKKVAKEKYDLDVEMVVFSDYISPNAALSEGSIDVNAFQHKPYLDQQMKDRGYLFEVAGNTLLYPIAAYSNKIKSLNELREGDQVALPNDPTNLGRSLLLLEKQGLIELKKGVGLQATVLDIVQNPQKLKLIELEAAQLPRSLDDVTFAIINTTYASAIDLSPEKDGLFVEEKNSPYVNLIVARADNAKSKNVEQFVKAYQSDEVFNNAVKIFDGGVVKGW